MPTVTRLRELGAARVAVELDGRPWRTLPAGVVVRAGVLTGRKLDRPALREVRRELRRAEALDVALGALARRDLSSSELLERLRRRGVPARAAAEALGGLERSGVVDEVRLAERRAGALAGRGQGDEAIRGDLARRGLAPDVIEEALVALTPEAERAREAVAVRGATPSTARFLARKGFSEETIEASLHAGSDERYDRDASSDISPAREHF